MGLWTEPMAAWWFQRATWETGKPHAAGTTDGRELLVGIVSPPCSHSRPRAQHLTPSQRPQSCRSGMSQPCFTTTQSEIYRIYNRIGVHLGSWNVNAKPPQKMFWLCNKNRHRRKFIHREDEAISYLSGTSTRETEEEEHLQLRVSFFISKIYSLKYRKCLCFITEETFTSAEEFHRYN